MAVYNLTKNVNSLRLQEELIAAGLASVQYIDTVGSAISIVFPTELSTGDQNLLNSIVASHQVLTTREYVHSVRESAMIFGKKIIDDFVEENIMLGITQANMTNSVRKILREVKDALTTGSLKDAIYELRQIPSDSKDGIFINNTRILAVINKLETYLEITPLSTEV